MFVCTPQHIFCPKSTFWRFKYMQSSIQLNKSMFISSLRPSCRSRSCEYSREGRLSIDTCSMQVMWLPRSMDWGVSTRASQGLYSGISLTVLLLLVGTWTNWLISKQIHKWINTWIHIQFLATLVLELFINKDTILFAIISLPFRC